MNPAVMKEVRELCERLAVLLRYGTPSQEHIVKIEELGLTEPIQKALQMVQDEIKKMKDDPTQLEVIGRLTSILVKSMNTIRGEPPEGEFHDFHNLPSHVELMKRRIQELEDELDEMDHEVMDYRSALHDVREWARPDHVMKFDDGDIHVSDFITNALNKHKDPT